MSRPSRIGNTLRSALEPHLANLKTLVSQNDYVAARNLLQQLLLTVQRSAGSRIHLELLKLMGLLCEMLGYRVEAGVHYCVAMRLAQTTDPRLERLLLQRLALLAHPEKQRPLLPAGADDEQLRALGQFLQMRLDCLWGTDSASLIKLVQPLGPLSTESDVGRWIAEDLGYLASELSPEAFREVLLAAPNAQWRNALIYARPGASSQ